MKEAVIYCRSQHHPASDQQRECEEYCRCHNFDARQVFADQGEDAILGNQPARRSLIEYCRTNRGRIKVVVITSPSRITRKILDRVKIKRTLEATGVKVEAVDNGFGLQSETGLEEAVMGARELNEAWRRKKAEESRTSSANKGA